MRVLVALLLLLLWRPPPSHCSRHTASSCEFPSRWAGRWFQSGVSPPIIIEGGRLSNKGRCLSSEGDKFLLLDEKGCYRCVVMHEKHENVLQYKETFCHRREALTQLCSLITGDALLYSMFRLDARPVPCPLRGPYWVSYNRGHGDCVTPASSLDSCTEDSRLLLTYQACPDVHGSESAAEELECLAAWKEGGLRFLVGALQRAGEGVAVSSRAPPEERYRCFVYERGPGGDAGDVRVAQSGDATCNGLTSATEGSRTLVLRRAAPRPACSFPAWLGAAPGWAALGGGDNYTFREDELVVRGPGGAAAARCVSVRASSPSGQSVALVATWRRGCAARHVCLVWYRRARGLAELQRGAPAARPGDACSPAHFDAAAAPYVTLAATRGESEPCPYPGLFEVSSLVPEGACSARSLRSGCAAPATMELLADCEDGRRVTTAYQCRGGWREDGVSFVVTSPLARDGSSARLQCWTARETAGGVQLARLEGSCVRSAPPALLAVPAAPPGLCRPASRASRSFIASPALLLSALPALLAARARS